MGSMYPGLPLGNVAFSGHLNDGNPIDYLEMYQLDVVILRVSPKSRNMVLRQIFRSGLKGKALTWYEDLPAEDREWTRLEIIFKILTATA